MKIINSYRLVDFGSGIINATNKLRKINADTKVPSIDEILNSVNRLVTLGDIQRLSDTEFRYHIGFTGYISQVLCGNEVAFDIDIPTATDGFKRGDIVVLNPDNDILLVSGVEDENNYIFPPIPDDVLEVGRHFIFGSTVSEPEIPNTGDAFMKKQIGTFAAASIEEVANYRFTENKRHLIITGELEEPIQGLAANPTAELSAKMEHTIENRSGQPFWIKHNGSGVTFKYFFPNAQDYLVQPNEIVVFKMSTALDKSFIFESSSLRGFNIPSQQQVTESGNTITDLELLFKTTDNDDTYVSLVSGGIQAFNPTSGLVLEPNYLSIGGSGKSVSINKDNIVFSDENSSDDISIRNDVDGYLIIESKQNQIAFEDNKIVVKGDALSGFKGLSGGQDFTENITELDYVQKKYVDNALKPIVVSSNATATLNRVHNVIENATLTDPSPIEGFGYPVNVINGIATVGGLSYQAGSQLYRHYHSGSWRTFVYPDLTTLSTLIDGSLTKDIIDKGLICQVPNIDGSYGSGAASQYLRLTSGPATQNIASSLDFGMSVGVVQTTSTAGTSGGIRRNDSINLQLYNGIVTIRDFTVDSAISNDCRYIVGFSKNYQFAFPSNAEPTTFTECILVAKLSTSNNINIIHNDNTGIATSIDLGTSFPANSNLYKYRMILIKESASSYYLQVIRTTLSTGETLNSTLYHLTSDLPTSGSVLQQIMWINNNASAVNMKLGDYGLIIKKN